MKIVWLSTVQENIEILQNSNWKFDKESHDSILGGFTKAETVSAMLLHLVDQVAVEKGKFESNSDEAGEIDLF